MILFSIQTLIKDQMSNSIDPLRSSVRGTLLSKGNPQATHDVLGKEMAKKSKM
jgi:hypothetical protein